MFDDGTRMGSREQHPPPVPDGHMPWALHTAPVSFLTGPSPHCAVRSGARAACRWSALITGAASVTHAELTSSYVRSPEIHKHPQLICCVQHLKGQTSRVVLGPNRRVTFPLPAQSQPAAVQP